ncbi:MAG: hypothetical protein LAP21_04055 [Acidobacteriia bacterium]|nr:hypothetical protein [Terriglobia bacterium]
MKNGLASVLFAGLLITMCAAADKKSASNPASKSAATTMDAWVSDKTCGANVDVACNKKCAAAGIDLVVVNSADKSVILVSNQDSLKPFIAQHVTIKGTMNNGKLTVASIKPVKASKK